MASGKSVYKIGDLIKIGCVSDLDIIRLGHCLSRKVHVTD